MGKIVFSTAEIHRCDPPFPDHKVRGSIYRCDCDKLYECVASRSKDADYTTPSRYEWIERSPRQVYRYLIGQGTMTTARAREISGHRGS